MRAQIPWGRIGIEGFVIVVSILLALAVQAWWDGRRERSEELQYLSAIQRELGEALERVPQASMALDRTLQAHEALLGQFSATEPAAPDTLLGWLAALSRPITFYSPQAVLSDVAASGRVQLVESDSLRLSLARFSSRLGALQMRYDEAWSIWTERIRPYLEPRVPRVDRLLSGGYPRPVPLAASPFRSSFSSIFSDPGFESMVAERWLSLDQAKSSLLQFEADMMNLDSLISEELDR